MLTMLPFGLTLTLTCLLFTHLPPPMAECQRCISTEGGEELILDTFFSDVSPSKEINQLSKQQRTNRRVLQKPNTNNTNHPAQTGNNMIIRGGFMNIHFFSHGHWVSEAPHNNNDQCGIIKK